MGLFDDLKKINLGKIVNTVEKSLGDMSESLGRPAERREVPAQPAAAYQSAPAARNDSVSVEQKFEQILSTEFSELRVVQNASPESVGIAAPSTCRPYSYALLRNGQTAAVIMLTPHNRDHNAAFINARKSALNANVAFLNFYTHFANERNYVISRIRDAL